MQHALTHFSEQSTHLKNKNYASMPFKYNFFYLLNYLNILKTLTNYYAVFYIFC
jgi:hypothetical protein